MTGSVQIATDGWASTLSSPMGTTTVPLTQTEGIALKVIFAFLMPVGMLCVVVRPWLGALVLFGAEPLLLRLLRRSSPSRLHLSAEGLIIEGGRKERRLRWDDVEWISVRAHRPRVLARQLVPDVSLDDSLRLEIGTRNCGTYRLRFGVPEDPRWDHWFEFIRAVEAEISRRQLPVVRERLAQGEELNFGAVRLSRQAVRVRRRFGWHREPMTVWRTIDGEPRRLRLPAGLVRNPSILARLLSDLTGADGQTLIESSRIGTYVALEIPIAK